MALFTKVSDEKCKKILTVKVYDRNVPHYEFEGDWVGRDVKLVGRTLARAYRKHVLAIRRAAHPALAEPPLSDSNTAAEVAVSTEV